jgi:hypothetical protein
MSSSATAIAFVRLHLLVVGLRRAAKTSHHLLAPCLPPKLEDWKAVLRKLLERGLRRVFIVIHDDFPGCSSPSTARLVQTDMLVGN